MPKNAALLDATGLATVMQGLGASSAEVKAAADALVDLELTAKATTGQELRGNEHVTDRWQSGEMHRTPTPEQIRVGPTEHASGGGAEKMVRDYAHPAPQDGLTVQAERLSNELGALRGYMKSVTDTVKTLAKNQEGLTAALTTLIVKQASEEPMTDANEATRFAEWHAKKAQTLFRAAQVALAKSQSIAAADAADPATKKSHKQLGKSLQLRAAELIHGALASTYAAKSEDSDLGIETRKAIHELLEENRALKADMSALHDKGKDDEKDEKKRIKKLAKKAAAKIAKKAAKRAAKTAAAGAGGAGEDTAAKGNQADKQDPQTKNQDDSSTTKKADPVDPDAVKKALEGIGVLQGTIGQVLEIVAGRPVTNNATQPLELIKSDAKPSDFLSIGLAIDQACDEGRLDDAAGLKARDLLSKATAVRDGTMSKEVWMMNYNSAPQSVQQILRHAA